MQGMSKIHARIWSTQRGLVNSIINPKMSLERFSSFVRMKALLFGIFLFLTASCSQSSLAVARYNFETLETKLPSETKICSKSNDIFGLKCNFWIVSWGVAKNTNGRKSPKELPLAFGETAHVRHRSSRLGSALTYSQPSAVK